MGKNKYRLSKSEMHIQEVTMVEFKLENPDKHDKKREELYVKVLALKDVVAYQDGTVASRMLVNKKAGSITVFPFDENEGVSEQHITI